jgi:crotonobetainyl-CoA:carnitine CoA-transferase CaiB-like acyl-CoA transferase
MGVFDEISDALGAAHPFDVRGTGCLPSYYAVSDLAVETIGAAASQLALYAGLGETPVVDRRLASLWFKTTVRPVGWKMPPPNPIIGDYRTADGWIRLHTDAPHHRARALSGLGLEDEAGRAAVAAAVRSHRAAALEAEIVSAGGCAAEMRSAEAWSAHPQGAHVASEPLIAWAEHRSVAPVSRTRKTAAPLSGVRVLDLTRVLAGPAATRFLAAFGADVLRIDPPWWSEPATELEMTVGKRCAGLDLRRPGDRERLLGLADRADIVVHGYRPHALAGLGVGPDDMRERNPGLSDICLCAYGWTGPWAGRRGFDSLIQMSAGIAHHGMTHSKSDAPTPLPAQALDHATGYLAAAACLRALRLRRDEGRVLSARLSLARTAELLKQTASETLTGALGRAAPDDDADGTEATDWGPARRLSFPVRFGRQTARWRFPAGRLRTSSAGWDAAFGNAVAE